MRFRIFKCTCIIFFMMFKVTGNCQTEQINGISFLWPGYLHEVPISNQMTARLHLGMLPQIQQKESEINGYLSGMASLAVRNYYNLNSRQNRGRNTELNSANYFSLSAQFITPPVMFYDNECNCVDFEGDPINRAERDKEDITQGVLLGINWGLQRNFNKRVSLDLNVGPSYLFKKNEFAFLTNITLVIWLNQYN